MWNPFKKSSKPEPNLEPSVFTEFFMAGHAPFNEGWEIRRILPDYIEGKFSWVRSREDALQAMLRMDQLKKDAANQRWLSIRAKIGCGCRAVRADCGWVLRIQGAGERMNLRD